MVQLNLCSDDQQCVGWIAAIYRVAKTRNSSMQSDVAERSPRSNRPDLIAQI
ncbi:MAG: hypothetical protein ACFE0J_05920 [Elainellaceae cyanobacterium]